MKNFKIIALLTLTTIIGFAFTNPNAILETLKVNTEKSSINWKGYKVTGQHEGTITVKEGELDFTEGVLTGGSFTIDMTSISTTDLEGGGKNKLDGHLKSADFFGVEKFPTATLKITKVASRGLKGQYKVTGNLTIKEATKEVRFNTTITEDNDVKTATADIKIDRTDFDVRYGSGSFFDNLGDKTIYDEFDLSVKLIVE